MKQYRAESLDALRGAAIFMMVMSGYEIQEVLPAWMSHAQVPPTGGFDPTIPGITWVDLVFPFFLFAMGASFPFSVGMKLDRGDGKLRLCFEALLRGLRLAFFAIFLAHVNPWILSHNAGTPETPGMWLLTLLAFALYFPMFMRLPGKHRRSTRIAVQVSGFVGASIMMWALDCYYGSPFDINRSNIIILVLANMAFFGTLIYIATYYRTVVRLGVLPLLMAILLSADADGSWQQAVFEWTPAPWLYRFMFLKYLFLIIPGTIAGEYLRKWVSLRPTYGPHPQMPILAAVVALVAIILVVNLIGLFGRYLTANFLVSVGLVTAIYFISRRIPYSLVVLRQLIEVGGYLLITGLFFEAFQGAIRKDPSTFSYYLVSGGLAFYLLAAFVIVCDLWQMRRTMALLTMSGKNPMIAYVATTMFTLPVLDLLHIGDNYTRQYFTTSPFLGFLHGFVLTVIACLIASFFTWRRLFWRT